MGQYYAPVNLDVKEYLIAHDYGNGLKLMEHSWLGNKFVNTVISLLSPGGTWYRTRLVWAGDYMDNEDFLSEFPEAKPNENLHTFATDNPGSGFTQIRPNVADGPELTVIVNHTLGEYVWLKKLAKDSDGWCVHPLPLLTSKGNGRGGGDYRGRSKFLERWAGHQLSAEYGVPDNLTPIHPRFTDK